MKSDSKEPADIEGDNSRQSSEGPVSHVHRHCLLCNSQESKPWGVVAQHGEKFEYLKCRRCGVVYKYPLPSNELIEYAKSRTYYRKPDQLQRHAMVSRIKKIEKFAPKGKILDVGCGTGWLLDVAAERGWDVFGVEPAQEGIEIIPTRLKNRIIQSVLTKGLFETESFDVVVLWSVIEHTHNPVEVLTIVADLLKKGGLLVIQTPNVDSLNARFFRGYWTSASFIDHLILWSRKSLLKVIGNLGFKVIKLQYAGVPFPLDYNFGKTGTYKPSKNNESQQEPRSKKTSKMRMLDRIRHKTLRSKACHFMIKNMISILHLGGNIEVYAIKT